jgi:hypothetical protein
MSFMDAADARNSPHALAGLLHLLLGSPPFFLA